MTDSIPENRPIVAKDIPLWKDLLYLSAACVFAKFLTAILIGFPIILITFGYGTIIVLAMASIFYFYALALFSPALVAYFIWSRKQEVFFNFKERKRYSDKATIYTLLNCFAFLAFVSLFGDPFGLELSHSIIVMSFIVMPIAAHFTIRFLNNYRLLTLKGDMQYSVFLAIILQAIAAYISYLAHTGAFEEFS